MSAPDLRQAQILMTLAGLAYGQRSELPRYLAEDALTAGDFELVWTPDAAQSPDNFALLVKSKTTGGYALAIRGAYPNPLSSAYWTDGEEDSPFGTMQPWRGAEKIGAKVSAGTFRGFQTLVNLSDGTRTLASSLKA